MPRVRSNDPVEQRLRKKSQVRGTWDIASPHERGYSEKNPLIKGNKTAYEQKFAYHQRIRDGIAPLCGRKAGQGSCGAG